MELLTGYDVRWNGELIVLILNSNVSSNQTKPVPKLSLCEYWFQLNIESIYNVALLAYIFSSKFLRTKTLLYGISL